MGTITGVVLNKNSTAFGHGIKIGDKWYNSKFNIPCEEGDTVTLEDGGKNYANKVKVIGKSSGGGSAGSTSPSSAPAASSRSGAAPSGYRGLFPIPANDGARAIVRQNSLTNAVNLISAILAAKRGPDAGTDLVVLAIEYAQTFEKYSSGDFDNEITKTLDSSFEVK